MKQTIKMTLFSPLHIGSGEELEPFSFIIRENVMEIFSFADFAASLTPENKTRLLELQQESEPSVLRNIRNFIRANLPSGAAREKIPVTPEVAQTYENKFTSEQNNLKMEPFIRTMGRPYIPGSSLKGAIRTAVLNEWGKKDSNRGLRSEFEILNARRRDNNNGGKDAIEMDPFKYLKVPDILLPEGSTFFAAFYRYKKVVGGDQRMKIQLFREAAVSLSYPGQLPSPPPQPLVFSLQVDEELMTDSRSRAGRRDLTLDTIWESLTFYDELRLKMEKEFSEGSELKAFYKKLGDYVTQEQKKDPKLRLIRLGFGSGYEAMTVQRIAKDKDKKIKTVAVCEEQFPPGWAVLSKS